MNSNIENYQVHDPTKKLTVINPNCFQDDMTNNDHCPSIMREDSSNKYLLKNMRYDEEFVLEEPSPAELEVAVETERIAENSYDQAFTKIDQEKFTDLYPLEPPKNKFINTDNIKFCSSKFYKFVDKIGDGKFEYISDEFEREMLVNAWQAITLSNNWDFVSHDINSFMLSKDPRINIIAMKMQELGYDGHSGCSFGYTMRNMQYLAKHGEKKFKQSFNVIDDDETEAFVNSYPALQPYKHENGVEFEQRLKDLIKRRAENKKRYDKLLDYMGGY